MKQIKLTLLATLLCWIFVSCQSQTKSREKSHTDTMDTHPILSETEDNIVYITSLWRDNRSAPDYTPVPADGEFYLSVSIEEKPKGQSKYSSISSYSMRVTGYPGNTTVKIRMESDTFYEDGVNVGHAHPTFEWVENDDFARQVLDYYEAHKEQVNIYVDHIDISSFHPIHLLSEDNNSLRYILSLTPVDTIPLYDNGDFCFQLETLTARKFVNYKNELQSYSIAKTWLHFIPSENRYWLRIKHFPTKSYYEGNNMQEIQFPNDNWETFEEVPDSYNQILDYYLTTSKQPDAREKVIYKFLITEVQSHLKGGKVICSYTDNQGEMSHFEGKFKPFIHPGPIQRDKEYALVPVQLISEVPTGTNGTFYLIDTEKPMGLVTKEGDTRLWADGEALLPFDIPNL